MKKKDEAFGIVPIWRQPEGDRFLLIQHWAGHWGFPKGHAEPGETAIVTACREFEEETGIKTYEVIDAISFTEKYSFSREGQTIEKTVTYFPAFVQTLAVTCQEQEIQAFAWVTFDDATQKITFGQARQLLVRVKEYLQNHAL
ncbi:MAG: NUDIX domain-containing protein [Drouetiella hepatica Uher 2000/2452]|uniref:Bis(5'-nucleosyl)-tetraphosphatase [asymmetrical] n=1 Tax=Drouetiella hepatica Uher 2000/2452 TaxID=904376 RepID=A0A951UL24_9CYAN|nr:NUDIX domain-containing protein [Drouetiella hepatica Uher 2000/2452]